MISKEFIAKTKKRLAAEEKKLTIQLQRFTEKSSQDPDDYQAKFPVYGDKEDENAAEVATFQDNLSLESNLKSSLKDVRRALDNLAKNKYGQCVKCNQEISQARLEIFPSAALCVACKNKETV